MHGKSQIPVLKLKVLLIFRTTNITCVII